MNIQYPKIDGGTPAQQLTQIRSYLYQLVQQLNMEAETAAGKTVAGTAAAASGNLPAAADNAGTQAPGPQSTFNSIKSLIIKSADIVNAYYSQISSRLDGVYVAESEFGEYKKETTRITTETSERVEQVFTNLQTITGQISQVIQVNANIRTGLLSYAGEEGEELATGLPAGTPVYGVEVGQTTEVDGKAIFNKFARFTAYGMVFYDENGNISAYISDNKLRIPHALIQVSLTRGGFVETIGSDGSSVERWVGV